MGVSHRLVHERGWAVVGAPETSSEPPRKPVPGAGRDPSWEKRTSPGGQPGSPCRSTRRKQSLRAPPTATWSRHCFSSPALSRQGLHARHPPLPAPGSRHLFPQPQETHPQPRLEGRVDPAGCGAAEDSLGLRVTNSSQNLPCASQRPRGRAAGQAGAQGIPDGDRGRENATSPLPRTGS